MVLIALPLVLYASLQALKRQPVVPQRQQLQVQWLLQLLSARVVAVVFDSLLGACQLQHTVAMFVASFTNARPTRECVRALCITPHKSPQSPQ